MIQDSFPQKVKIIDDYGLPTLTGKIFVRGVFPVPEGHPETDPEDWYWEEGTTYEGNHFLHKNCFNGTDLAHEVISTPSTSATQYSDHEQT